MKLLIHSQISATEVWEWISNFISHVYWAYDYWSLLKLKWIHVNKMTPGINFCNPASFMLRAASVNLLVANDLASSWHMIIRNHHLFFNCMKIMLTDLPLDKMAAILQMTFSNELSWMKSILFWFDFHWSLFPSVQLISQHWFRWWLGTVQVTSHYLYQWWPSLLNHTSIDGS